MTNETVSRKEFEALKAETGARIETLEAGTGARIETLEKTVNSQGIEIEEVKARIKAVKARMGSVQARIDALKVTAGNYGFDMDRLVPCKASNKWH